LLFVYTLDITANFHYQPSSDTKTVTKG